MPQPMFDRIVQAVGENLQWQSEKSGCTTEIHGSHAQVDGGFNLTPLVLAALLELRRIEATAIAEAIEACAEPGDTDPLDIFRAVIDHAMEGEPE